MIFKHYQIIFQVFLEIVDIISENELVNLLEPKERLRQQLSSGLEVNLSQDLKKITGISLSKLSQISKDIPKVYTLQVPDIILNEDGTNVESVEKIKYQQSLD